MSILRLANHGVIYNSSRWCLGYDRRPFSSLGVPRYEPPFTEARLPLEADPWLLPLVKLFKASSSESLPGSTQCFLSVFLLDATAPYFVDAVVDGRADNDFLGEWPADNAKRILRTDGDLMGFLGFAAAADVCDEVFVFG